jgi:hypothetical protein
MSRRDHRVGDGEDRPPTQVPAVTVREALLAPAAPEPEPFRQVWPTPADHARWNAWHDRYLEALQVAKSIT